MGCRIRFAYPSFIWSNLAKNKAGVTVIVVGLDFDTGGERFLIVGNNRKGVPNINPYLTEHTIDVVSARRRPLCVGYAMDYGVYYSKSAGLILDQDEKNSLIRMGLSEDMIRRFLGSTEFINGKERYCLWLDDQDREVAEAIPEVRARIESVRRDRLETDDAAVNKLAARPHQFRERKGDCLRKIFIPIVSSENRDYLPVGVADETVIPTNKSFYMDNAPLWCLAVLSSKLHLAWIAAVCGRLRSDYSYSNTLGWNTFPIPTLTEKSKADLTRCAENILLAREAHYPASLADLYEVREGESMIPEDLRAAHEQNDEVLERIYIGRSFRNDTERLEKLFEMYSQIVAAQGGGKKAKGKKGA